MHRDSDDKAQKGKALNRRKFLGSMAAGTALGLRAQRFAPRSANAAAENDAGDAPNLVFVFADQWRAQALGYAGDPNVKTPNLDRLAARSLKFTNTVA